MVLVILSYILIAALEGIISEKSLYYSNMIYLLIFFTEFCLKLIGYGIKGSKERVIFLNHLNFIRIFQR